MAQMADKREENYDSALKDLKKAIKEEEEQEPSQEMDGLVQRCLDRLGSMRIGS
jgi:hypothetical protein